MREDSLIEGLVLWLFIICGFVFTILDVISNGFSYIAASMLCLWCAGFMFLVIILRE